MKDKVKRISSGYIPRPHQQIIHKNRKRFNVLVCHRRFGKTVLAVQELLDNGLRNMLAYPQYAYIAPNYGQAKRVAWEIIKQATEHYPGRVVHEGELRIDLPRPHRGDKVRFMLLGAEKPDSIRGIYLDGVVLDEYGDCSPIVWGEVVRPALSDRHDQAVEEGYGDQNGWAIFIGTPKGQNHFYDLYMMARANPNWYAAMFKASDTKVVSANELKEAKAEITDEQYEQEFECSFSAALTGSYYGKYVNKALDEGRITDVPHDPALQVNTYWDLGVNDTTAIWFIQQGRENYRVIDYIENSGEGLEWYAKQVKEKNYNYGEHVVPHDGKQRNIQTGLRTVDTLANLLGTRPRVLPRTMKIEDDINAVRIMLPKCLFDAVKTKRGLDCLMNYQKKYDHKNQIFSTKPLHNWASNGADAFRYFAVSHKRSTKDTRSLPRQAVIDYDW